MRAVVIGVGDELLSGLVVNSNAAVIGELLLAVGIPVAWSMCVGDEEDDIVGAIDRAASDADVVIVTGGLGPTQDDLTREAIARLLGTELVRDEAIVDDIRARFKAFGREMPPSNAKQADIPATAKPILNPWGTAPGIRAEHGGAVVYAIPGVPMEARRMVTEAILPELSSEGTIRTRELRCVGMSESGLADLFPDLAVAPNPKMAFLPGGGEIRLRFVAHGHADADCAALLDAAERIVRERVGDIVVGAAGETLEAVVGAMLAERRLTVATAESCTAGLLAARFANVPGASGWLRGGVVAYASELKTSELGVASDLIDREGAVSEAVAAAMAQGVKRRLRSDVALAVTCAAGPEPQDGAHPGQIFLALAGLDGSVSAHGARFPGDRDQVRTFATTFALNLLRLHLVQTA